jgi:hypothetical protein
MTLTALTATMEIDHAANTITYHTDCHYYTPDRQKAIDTALHILMDTAINTLENQQ